MATVKKAGGSPSGTRRFFTTIPRRQRTARVPQAGSVRRADAGVGTGLPTLDVEIPGNQEENLIARWEVWQQGPGGSVGSLPEFVVWEWLVKRKKQVPGYDFLYQWNVLGGRTAFGGFVADYFLPELGMVWNVQGLQYHYTNPDDRARDKMATTVLASSGFLVVELFEDDLMNRPEYTLERAWLGESVSWRAQ